MESLKESKVKKSYALRVTLIRVLAIDNSHLAKIAINIRVSTSTALSQHGNTSTARKIIAEARTVDDNFAGTGVKHRLTSTSAPTLTS